MCVAVIFWAPQSQVIHYQRLMDCSITPNIYSSPASLFSGDEFAWLSRWRVTQTSATFLRTALRTPLRRCSHGKLNRFLSGSLFNVYFFIFFKRPELAFLSAGASWSWDSGLRSDRASRGRVCEPGPVVLVWPGTISVIYRLRAPRVSSEEV